jgi:hypothetical protein
MIEINEIEKIRTQLKSEGKTKYLDQPEDIQAMICMNKQMETVRKEFIKKNNNSEISAAKVIFTA